MRTIPITVTAASTSPVAVRDAGMIGEHLASQLVFSLPQEYISEAYSYYILCTDGNGSTSRSSYLTVDATNRTASYDIPQAWTMQNAASCSFNVVKIGTDGKTEQLIKSLGIKLFFNPSDTMPQEVDNAYEGTLDQLIVDTNTAKASANTEATNAKVQADNALTQAGNAKTQADNALLQANNAKTQSDNAKVQADNALAQANYAKAQGDNAVSIANKAATDAENGANYAKTQGDSAVAAANNAAANAGAKATYAQNQGDYAKSQGDYANQQGASAVSTTNAAISELKTNEALFATTAYVQQEIAPKLSVINSDGGYMNDFRTTGIYCGLFSNRDVPAEMQNMTNQNYALIVSNTTYNSQDYTAQICIPESTNCMFYRTSYYVSSTEIAWTAWQKVSTADDLTTHINTLATGTKNGHMSSEDWTKLYNIAASVATPAALGTAAAGTSTKYAREDHVHQLPSTATSSSDGLMSKTDKAKLDGIEAGATTDMTASEILTAVKTIDGPSSGLDADLLDGKDSSAFSLASHTHTKSQITDFPTSLPANGGNADTVGGHGTDNGPNSVLLSGRKSDTTIGTFSTAEGNRTTAGGTCSHAEGNETTASGECSHAEGASTTASGKYSHAEGGGMANGDYSHAEGLGSAGGSYSHAEGLGSTGGSFSHAEGGGIASGECSHAEGASTTASGKYSHAEGNETTADADYMHAMGQFNKLSSTLAARFVIGNGTSDTALANIFRVDPSGSTYGVGAFNTSGADYAEYFEWLDENPNKEDRAGHFVTLDGEKIKYANDGDYIVGIVSGAPAIVGDHPSESWAERYTKDIFGRIQYHTADVPEETKTITKPDGTTETIVIMPAHTEVQPVVNPNYDPTKENTYQNRESRPEWAAVGMVGKLICVDDGTCEVNGYCKPKDGIAVKADSGYRVISRLDKTHIKVLIK